MTKEKIIAQEVVPEQADLSEYFDCDLFNGEGFVDEADKRYSKLFIIGDDRHSFLNKEDYEDLLKKIDEISEDFISISDSAVPYDGCTTYKDVMEYYSVEYTPQKCNDLKELLLNLEYPIKAEDVARYLEIESGKEFKCANFNGNYQGSYCDVVYCPEYYGKESIEEAADMYLGKGTEFEIDDCYGYYVSERVRWKEGNELVEYLAEAVGVRPEELEVRLYEGKEERDIYSTLTYKEESKDLERE